MLRAKFTLLACPGCGGLMMVYDIHDTKLSVGKCENCGKEYEVRENEEGLKLIITPKKVS